MKQCFSRRAFIQHTTVAMLLAMLGKQGKAADDKQRGRVMEHSVAKPTIGEPLKRIDGPAKVTGMARYTADITLPRKVYTVLVESSIAHGKTLQIDVAPARAAAGVIHILTHENAERLRPTGIFSPGEGTNKPPPAAASSMLPLQDETIYYLGQPVVVVIAETLEQAQHAATLVQIRYQIEPALADLDAELASAYGASLSDARAGRDAGDVRAGNGHG